MSVLLAATIFASKLANPDVLARLPLRVLLKDHFGWQAAATAGFFALIKLPWYGKPIAALFSDSLPIFGTRRRSYLIGGASIGCALWLALTALPPSYRVLASTLVLVNVALVFVSTALGGVLVEQGQRHGATGQLSSLRMTAEYLAVMIAGPIGGYLTSRALGVTFAISAVALLAVVPLVYLMLEEPTLRSPDWSWSHVGQQTRNIVRNPPLLTAGGLFALHMISPGFQTPLFYYQTDQLRFSVQFIGNLGLVSNGAMVLGALCYAVVARRMELGRSLWITIAASAGATLLFLFYRSANAAIAIEAAYGFAYELAFVALMDFAVRATSPGSEAMGLALMMSAITAAEAGSDVIGSWLYSERGLGITQLVWLNAGTTALVLLVLPFLPRGLLSGSDTAKDLPHDER